MKRTGSGLSSGSLSRRALLATIAFAAAALCGCASMEIEPASDVWRTANGLVYYNSPGPLPPGSVLTVRVIDNSNPAMGPMIVGEASITDPAPSPAPFAFEFRAEDPVLRRGLSLEARISVEGRLRYSNQASHSVNASNLGTVRELYLAQTGI